MTLGIEPQAFATIQALFTTVVALAEGLRAPSRFAVGTIATAAIYIAAGLATSPFDSIPTTWVWVGACIGAAMLPRLIMPNHPDLQPSQASQARSAASAAATCACGSAA